MKSNIQTIRKSLNKAYLKVKPYRPEFEAFKKNLLRFIDQIDEPESEEFHKNVLSEFLKSTYYSPDHNINTKGRFDLVIHTGKNTESPVGVLIETKRPGDKTEMPTEDNLNTKAFHELLLYWLRERITGNNLEIKYLIATDMYDWFIFNAGEFEKLFAGNKQLVKQFMDFEEGRLSGKTTDFFYRSIAEPFIEQCDQDISVTHIDIRDYEKILREGAGEEENKLIALYKVFSPEHLLKLPFTNDSNTLDKGFYNELLHIIGLKETKEGSKKLIGRKPEGERNTGSLIENAVNILQYEDCLSQVKASGYGTGKEEQLYHIALELVITWINRILFLKLLEGQLVRYNRGDENFRFLNAKRIPDYDTLNKLFFQVLAVKESERGEPVRQNFRNVPYLNSSLFEPGELEHKTIRISNLDDEPDIPLLNATVLKDNTGKRRAGRMNTLHYLFAFLDTYDFSSEGSEEIQEESKTLINASVLGLIFEKINGYKDGSFFTPGFITMYMCRETIRRAVVQKFNDAKGWNCETIPDVFNKINDEKEANRIINSLKVCDPAVGSGHFLVSALNEIIAIKSELKILLDREGRRLKYYHIEVANDELVITDEEGELFEYNPASRESQRIQEALFHEKQALIENCLFGVDINPNSVKICRLRLWIELLKSAYYKTTKSDSQGLTQSQALTDQLYELETLPNIDINIKCGNSLISRYPLDADIKKALRDSRWSVESYCLAVMTYRNAQNKEEKREMEKLIAQIKGDFESEVAMNDKRLLRLNKLKGELMALTTQISMFEKTKAEKIRWEREVKKLAGSIEKLEKELEDIRNNRIYENAFEWRFEFPEVLNDDGDFMGFDVVIGNPPYGLINKKQNQKISLTTDALILDILKEKYPESTGGMVNAANIFYSFGLYLVNKTGFQGMIVPFGILTDTTSSNLRKHILEHHSIIKIEAFPERDNISRRVFEDVKMSTAIIITHKEKSSDHIEIGISYDRIIETNNRLYLNVKDLFELNPELVQIPLTDKDKFNILLKIYRNKNIIKIKDISPCLTGEVDMTFAKSALTDINSHKKLIKGVQIDRYIVKSKNEEISQGIIEFLDLNEFQNLYKGKKLEDALKKRLVLQGLTGVNEKIRLKATNVNPECYLANSCNYLLPNKIVSLEYLLSIINSSLLNFLFKTKSTSSNVNGYEVDDLPIIIDGKYKAKLENLVTMILNTKKSDPNADTNSLEADIDRQVYELYGLTDEEIRIVEGAVG